MIKKSVFAILIIVIVGTAIAWISDYSKVSQGFSPKLCLKEETFTYEDGNATKCTGLGYNVFNYERKSNTGVKFLPFWVEMEE